MILTRAKSFANQYWVDLLNTDFSLIIFDREEKWVRTTSVYCLAIKSSNPGCPVQSIVHLYATAIGDNVITPPQPSSNGVSTSRTTTLQRCPVLQPPYLFRMCTGHITPPAEILQDLPIPQRIKPSLHSTKHKTQSDLWRITSPGIHPLCKAFLTFLTDISNSPLL